MNMSPWDAYRWFETPAERTLAVPADGTWVQLVPRNVRRVGLVFGCPPTFSARISLNQGAANSGYWIGSSTTPVFITQQQHGNLCQEPWYGAGAPGSLVTVTEVLLRDWPHTEEGPPDGA